MARARLAATLISQRLTDCSDEEGEKEDLCSFGIRYDSFRLLMEIGGKVDMEQ